MSGKVPMTKEGYKWLMEELRRLKTEERPKVVEEIRIAREHGDLSENAEYDAAKEKQSHIEGRIREIEDKLSRAEVIDLSEKELDKVVFGTTVQLRDENSGNEVEYHIVGADEADPQKKKISVHSPIARALIGREVGDEVKVKVPAGMREYTVLNISL